MTKLILAKSIGIFILLLLTAQTANATVQVQIYDADVITDCRTDSVVARLIQPPAFSEADTIPVYAIKQDQFRPKQLILPCALFAVGTFGVYNGAFRKLDNKIKDGMDNLRGNCYFRIDDWVQYLPALTYISFGSIGIKSKHSFKERVVVEATAYLSMTILVNAGKWSFKEKRPDSEARNSFPSGHTATVFTGAELMREEYGAGLGIASYGVAAGVAFLRLYNGRHWFNDVIAGAGLGVLSARIGYWMLPLYQKWFGWDRRNCGKVFSVLPAYTSENHCVSLNVSIQF
ncbi:MAG: phosphatase PAP2 family protein [Duncaniella sp.]|nr:phosphatase PAP2 family protein [Duncaniella sp.]